MAKYTDLAMEARELWQEEAGKTTKLTGVRARQWHGKGITVTKVEILDRNGVRALRKPVGNYVTLEWKQGYLREPAGFTAAAVLLGKELSRMIPRDGPVLVVGLGNGAVTPDAVGPRTLEKLVVTRHLAADFPQFRSVSAVAPGVLGTTGLESVEVVRGIVEKTKPSCVIAVDALASGSLSRVCATVQLTDTGITPGSGVGNHRRAFDRQSLGVPVVALGVPTVVQAQTLLESVSRENKGNSDKTETKCDKNMIVTPRDIDAGVDRAAKLLGYGISLGLHRGLTVSDVSCFVG